MRNKQTLAVTGIQDMANSKAGPSNIQEALLQGTPLHQKLPGDRQLLCPGGTRSDPGSSVPADGGICAPTGSQAALAAVVPPTP